MKQIICNENFRQLAHSRTEIKRSEEKPRRCRQSVKHHRNIFSQPKVATREYDWDLGEYFDIFHSEWQNGNKIAHKPAKETRHCIGKCSFRTG